MYHSLIPAVACLSAGYSVFILSSAALVFSTHALFVLPCALKTLFMNVTDKRHLINHIGSAGRGGKRWN